MSCGVGQMQLESSIAVAVAKAGSCSSNSTPRLGTSICLKYSPKKKKKKKVILMGVLPDLKKIFLIEVWLISNVVQISAVQQDQIVFKGWFPLFSVLLWFSLIAVYLEREMEDLSEITSRWQEDFDLMKLNLERQIHCPSSPLKGKCQLF